MIYSFCIFIKKFRYEHCNVGSNIVNHNLYQFYLVLITWIFTDCAQLQCSNANHEKCEESASQGPLCVCRNGFINSNGICTSGEIVIVITIKFTLSYVDTLSDRYHPETINFIEILIPRLRRAMLLKSFDYISIISFSSGSTITNFEVILSSNTTETEATIINNLQNDIFNNATESLFHYYPTAADSNNTILGVNSK